jgi:hypothetical protein
MRLLAIILLGLLTACTTPLGSGERRFTGEYREGLETMVFQADGGTEAWAARGPAIYALQAAAPPRAHQYDGFRIRATIVGRLSPPGRYGHLGMFPREIEIIEVIETSPAL